MQILEYHDVRGCRVERYEEPHQVFTADSGDLRLVLYLGRWCRLHMFGQVLWYTLDQQTMMRPMRFRDRYRRHQARVARSVATLLALQRLGVPVDVVWFIVGLAHWDL